MTSSVASWRLDRLSASAREAAELASIGAGITLSAWLTRIINDACAAEGVTLRENATVVEFARKSLESSTASASDELLPPAPSLAGGAIMVPLTALVPANLGTRLGETLPE